MEIFTWNHILEALDTGKENPYFNKGCGISVGSFDGLHKGHKVLLNTLLQKCKENNFLSGVVTFKRPLPSLKHKSDYAGDISTLNQRIELMEQMGIDFVIIVDFDDSFASMMGTDFFNILINVCNMKLLAEGVDFRCGYKGATDTEALRYFGEKSGIRTFFVDPVFYKESDEIEERVSSSYIRGMIQKGFFTTVNYLLERAFVLDLPVEVQVLPPDGIYLCKNEKNQDVRAVIKNKNITTDCESKKLIF